jgi:glycosyltransferase involved in cell wall biosynthesis
MRQAEQFARIGFEPIVFNASNVRRREDVTLESPPLPSWYLDRTSMHVSFFPWLVASFYRAFQHHDVEIVHSMSPGTWFNLAALAAARVRDIPVVIESTMLDGDDLVSIAHTRLGTFKRWLLEQADGVVNISPGLRERSAQLNFDDSDLFVVPNPVDCDRFHPPEPPERQRLRRELELDDFSHVLLSVGQLMKRKGSQMLVKVFRQLADDFPKAALALVSPLEESPYLEELRERIREWGLADRILTPGYSDRVSDWMKASDVYLFASRQEGLGTVVMEAMASGLPIVSRRLEGITDFSLDHRESGILVDDRRQMVREVRELLENPERRRTLGRVARNCALERFEQDVIARQYSDIFHSYMS